MSEGCDEPVTRAGHWPEPCMDCDGCRKRMDAMSTPNAELVGFLRGIFWPHPGNLDGCGALADWLVEHDDARGVLLKRRWQRWRKERDKVAAEFAQMKEVIEAPWRELQELCAKIKGASVTVYTDFPAKHYGQEWADDSFRKYLREKFPAESDASRWAEFKR